MPQRFELIEERSELERVAALLAKETLIAVDVEADSLYHYAPRVCLLQISCGRRTYLVDPLATGTLSPLSSVLSSTETRKVFHGADYDLRSLFRDYRIVTNNIFDTMIASQFVGDKAPGLAAVIHRRFGITLEKKYQKANWSKRPLSNDMLSYAAQDTVHLLKLYKELKRELTAKGRLEWVEEECECLTTTCTSPPTSQADDSEQEDKPHMPLFRRFKGAGTMNRRDLAVLENLLRFRENEAMQQDKPPFKVFGNNVIKTLVAVKPADETALAKTPKLPRNFIKKYGRGALRAVAEAVRLPENRLPSYPSSPRPPANPEKQMRLKGLKRWRRKCASRLKLQPGLICNNVLLNRLADVQPTSLADLDRIPEIRRWQKETFGEEIIKELHPSS
jgi:ribonuclease D